MTDINDNEGFLSIYCNEGETPLTQLIIDNNMKEMKELLNMTTSTSFTQSTTNHDSNSKFSPISIMREVLFLYKKNSRGFYPLNVAIFCDNDVAVDLLIEAGVDIERKISPGTALHQCAGLGKEMFLKKLIAVGANIEAVDDENVTPIFYAAALNHDHIAKALIEVGANVNHIGKHNSNHKIITPLDLATMQNSDNVIKILKDAGALTYEELLERKNND